VGRFWVQRRAADALIDNAAGFVTFAVVVTCCICPPTYSDGGCFIAGGRLEAAQAFAN